MSRKLTFMDHNVAPKIRIVGQDYCNQCHRFLREGIQNALSDEKLDGKERKYFQDDNDLITCADEFSFFEDFGPNMLIICCDSEEPVYQVAAELCRQGKSLGAIFDGTKVSGSSNIQECNPRSPNFEEILKRYNTFTPYDPRYLTSELYEYEKECFPNTKWVLYGPVQSDRKD